MKSVNTFVFLIIAVISPCSQAQGCISSISATTLDQNYTVNANGTIIDTRRNIMWTRCSIGQQWENETCDGVAIKLGWTEAGNIANTSDIAGFSDWRLPDIYELSGITELQCQQPAINLTLFPATPPADYWTATEFVNNTDLAWLVNFVHGENHSGKKLTGAAVRLVRSINPATDTER